MPDEEPFQKPTNWPPFYLSASSPLGKEGERSPREPQQRYAAYGSPSASAGKQFDAYVPVVAEVVGRDDSTRGETAEYVPPPRSIMWPLILFVATCWSTYYAGNIGFTTYAYGGVLYAVAVMFILTAHELGHFFQALRYRIHASFPMFIPMPISPLGTLGAVIGMAPGEGDRKALFDVAVSGPIAGLIPSLICCLWGLSMSAVVPAQVMLAPGQAPPTIIGSPWIFDAIKDYVLGPLPPGMVIDVHPIAYAGWVGLLITALNLFPIGQLDGGHTLYALVGKKAHAIARLAWAGCFAAIVVSGNWGWSLMLGLLWMMGTDHPPTADDSVPLGTMRKLIGWGLLLFVPFGFTPTPFIVPKPAVQQQQQDGPRMVELQPSSDRN